MFAFFFCLDLASSSAKATHSFDEKGSIVQRPITDTWLRSLMSPAAGRLEIWDTRVQELALRITAASAASWSVRTMTREGKPTRATLRTWPAIGIAETRKRALHTLAEIQGGGDPVRHATRGACGTPCACRPALAPDLVERQLAAAAPNRLWVADISVPQQAA